MAMTDSAHTQNNGTCDVRIPPTKAERNRCLAEAALYAEKHRLVPPLAFRELMEHCEALCKEADIAHAYKDFLAVCLNNEAWRPQLAGIPFDKRLLLLPQCLRHPEACRAPIDAFGLSCRFCGNCVIGDLQHEAEQMGYTVLVAEGSPIVTSLLRSGRIKAVIGVSCLNVLEQVFPYMEAGAIPGLAVPLLRDGCSNTAVDIDWVWDAIHLSGSSGGGLVDIDGLREEVRSWFRRKKLQSIMGPPRSETERIARNFLTGEGKRWRPFLTACAYQALMGGSEEPIPEAVKSAAVAVECFHKASLVHDDIEDEDSERYGRPTLHKRYGIPVALNAGDLLVGEGYRLLAEADTPYRAALLRAAAQGHRTLCNGQGAELAWARKRRVLSPAEVLEIFSEKTAPAFEVALKLGIILGGRGEELTGVIHRFSTAVGIAYQIRDDLQDAFEITESAEAGRLRPSLLLALATERAGGAERKFLDRFWRFGFRGPGDREKLNEIFTGLGVLTKTAELVAWYKDQAIRALCGLDNPNLKALLRRIVGKIFRETDSMECCHEYRTQLADGRQGGFGAA